MLACVVTQENIVIHLGSVLSLVTVIKAITVQLVHLLKHPHLHLLAVESVNLVLFVQQVQVFQSHVLLDMHAKLH